MKLYADTHARRTRQIVSDVWMLFWIALWIWIGVKVDNLVMNLAAPGRKLAEAGDDFQGGLLDAGDKVAQVPLIGDSIRTPFEKASGAGGALKSAGEAQIHAVDKLATFLGVVIAVMPILILVILWAPRRWRFIQQATSAQKFIDAAPDLDLFALRALTRQPMTELAGIHDDPAGAWRAKDPVVIRALATLELKETGLRPPALA